MQTKSDAIRLYVVEEQEIYREVYEHVLLKCANIKVLRISGIGQKGSIQHSAAELSPNVLLLSIKKLNKDLTEEIENIKNSDPVMGIVVLTVLYSSTDVDLLHRIALCCKSGLGLFLKQSLDNADELSRLIVGVSQGAVILDPTLATFMFAPKPESPFLKQLTARELEILGLLSQGYTNAVIATTLFIDIKTVEHHLNSLYAKLKENPGYDAKHMRVSAARLFMESNDIFQKSSEPSFHETMVSKNHHRKISRLQLPLIPCPVKSSSATPLTRGGDYDSDESLGKKRG